MPSIVMTERTGRPSGRKSINNIMDFLQKQPLIMMCIKIEIGA